VAPISGEGGPLAVMLVDEIVLQEPAPLQAVGAMARLALENERLQAEVRSQLVQLRSTTARLVEAGQDARRRIERDLHDGAQQRPLALSMTLGRARARADGADPQLRAFLDHAADDLQQAITELRELARGIHPMLLTQEGLASALTALAERALLPVQVTAPTCRFPDTVESTAYFVVSEAVTNAARHAAASVVRVDVTVAGDELTVRVSDDGIGGANPATAGGGSGLLGMRDRVVALGGRMTVTSPTGGGTTVVARLPCG
jgi:signal transduction histidine kinase